MPISIITELAEVSTCSTWLTSASSPLAARNAVSASTTGSSAASSAPKTTSRMPRASGTTVHSACLKSRKIVSLNHLVDAGLAELLDRDVPVRGLRPA